MNIFRKLGCRIVHCGLKLVSPFLPYRAPRLLSYEEAATAFRIAGKKRALLVTGKRVRAHGLCEHLLAAFASRGIEVEIFDEVPANPTVQAVENAYSLYREKGCDCVITLGGGSPMDCAKGVCARVASPKKSIKKMKGALKVKGKVPLLLAVPTTSGSGSEASVAAVITDEDTHEKFAVISFRLVPKFAVLDPELTRSLPPAQTAETGMDALTHAVEAFVGKVIGKKSGLLAQQAVSKIFTSLPRAYADGQNEEARKEMALASYSAGLAFTVSYVGYVHALAHALGGVYGLPHGRLCAVLLPQVLRAYGKKAHKKLARLAIYCGLCDKKTPKSKAAELFIQRVEELLRTLNIPQKIEIREEDIPLLARRADREANPLYPVPRLLGRKELIAVIRTVMA